MSYLKVLLLEAIFVGIITLCVGYISSFIIAGMYKQNLPEECKSWNKNYVMEKSLFLTGFLVHLICESLKINKWYCLNGVACLN